MILLLQTAFDALNKCPITVRRAGWMVGGWVLKGQDFPPNYLLSLREGVKTSILRSGRKTVRVDVRVANRAYK